MHIALILSGLGAGGAERVLALLAGHWQGRGHRVTIIAFDNPGDPVFHDFGTARLVRLGLAGGTGALPRRLVRLRRVLVDHTPDIIVSFLFKINVTTLLAATGLGIPVIVSERNNPARQPAHPLWTLLRRVTYPRAAALVLQTEASRAALPPGIARAGTVIANPIVATPRAPEPAGRKILAAVGRLDDQKGFDLLVPAFAAIAPRHPDWDLVIWGEGPRRAALEAQVAGTGLAARIRLPGLSATPGGWIASASAFVLSSRYEGFCNAMAEAMAAGLPVVAFGCDHGVADIATPDVDALVVAPEDGPALVAALDRLLGDGELRARLGAAATVGVARFGPDAIVSRWDALLETSRATRPIRALIDRRIDSHALDRPESPPQT